MSVPAWIAVGLLGGLAAGARYLIDFEVSLRARGPFPLGILVVNLSASIALGLVAGAALHGEALAIVAGGGLGSFSPFSTWVPDPHPPRAPPPPPGSAPPASPASPGSTSASRSSSASPPSPSATGSAGPTDRCPPPSLT